jgi:phage gpG-like protein
VSGEVVSVSLRAEAFLGQLASGQKALTEAMVRVVNRLSILVQAHVKGQKLTGQVLHVRTGTLRRSINRRVYQEGEAVWAVVGTNVRYAAIHEYGFTGAVSVREHVRKIRAPARMVVVKNKLSKSGVGTWQRKQGAVVGEAVVKQHVRQVSMPERSFLRSSIRDLEPIIRRDIRAAALEVLK